MVIVNTELFLYLDPPILKGGVYPIKWLLRVKELNGF